MKLKIFSTDSIKQQLRIKEQIIETIKPIAIGIWILPPIELLTGAIVVPVTISLFCWLFKFIGPLLTWVGYLAGVVYAVTAIAKFVYVWRLKRSSGEPRKRGRSVD